MKSVVVFVSDVEVHSQQSRPTINNSLLAFFGQGADTASVTAGSNGILSVMRTPIALPPYRKSGKERAMQKRLFEPPAAPLDRRLEDRAKRLRKEARGTSPGVEREKLMRLARQAETAAHIRQWLTSPGLQAPR